MPHRIIAIDQRSRGCRPVDRDVGLRVEPAGFQAPHILRQAEYAMRVRAGQVRFAHQPAAHRRALARQPRALERILDQRTDRRNRHTG